MSNIELPAPTGATISLYLADGVPGGIRLIEKDNWSGVGVDCSRSDLARARKREEFARSGVYLLIGDEEDASGLPTLYIGEADHLGNRIPNHGKGKDFWTRVVSFTSKDGSINKAHALHLESRLCAIAVAAKRCELDNGNTPGSPILSDSDRDSAERFLSEMLLVLPALGVTAFEMPTADAAGSGGPIFRLKGKGATALGRETAQGFTVISGSRARLDEVKSVEPWVSELRNDLLANGTFKREEEGMLLTQDYVFKSPSTAAAVFLGRPANGRTEWKTESGVTLKSIQDEALQSSD